MFLIFKHTLGIFHRFFYNTASLLPKYLPFKESMTSENVALFKVIRLKRSVFKEVYLVYQSAQWRPCVVPYMRRRLTSQIKETHPSL